MTLLEETIAAISVPDAAPADAVRNALRTHKNVDFGRLEDALLRYVRICGTLHPAPPQTSVVISCADHGVAAESVSAYPPETTLNMMCNYLVARGGAANAVANYAGAALMVADLGVNADTAHIPGLIRRSIARGTANMTTGPAMTRAQAVRAVETGIEIAGICAARGDRCILPGEMGISNTTASAAMVAAILGLSPEEVTGRGANISDKRLAHKIEIVRRALAVNAPDPQDGLDVLAKVGGFELGCIAGLILGAAARRMLVILDGANTTSASLIAHALAPHCAHFLLASHASLTEHSQPHALRRLGLAPMLRLDIRLSEAAGSSIARDLLIRMLRVWNALDAAPAHSENRPVYTVPSSAPTNAAHAPQLAGRIPAPNKQAMEACRYRLDNLAKPMHSLGFLEQIAVRLAGTTGNPQPPIDTPAAMLLISASDRLSPEHEAILAAMRAHADVPIYLLPLPKAPAPHAFRIAYQEAQCIARHHPVVLVGMTDPPSMRQSEEPYRQAFAGVLTAAARCRSLILPGDAAADAAAHRWEEADPTRTPYILHVLPDMLTLDAAPPPGTAGLLACGILRAALHALNDMKTFTEANVAVAIDGAGAGRQVRHKI